MIEEQMKDGQADASLLARWEKLGLNELQEFVLISIFPPIYADLFGTLQKYEQEGVLLRGLDRDSEYWFTSDTVRSLIVNKETLASHAFKAKLISSLMLWLYDSRYVMPAIELLRKFEEYTAGNFLFENLEDEWSMLYSRASLLLMVNYFEEMPPNWQAFLLNSGWFHVAIAMNLDLDGAMRKGIDSIVYMPDRREESVRYATFIYTNDSPIGTKPDLSGPGTNAYWIDRFRQFSKQKFDGMSLLAFMNEEREWEGCILIEDKMIVHQVLVLYSHLILDNYVNPTLTDSERARLLKEINTQKSVSKETNTNANGVDYGAIKKEIETQFPKNKDGEYEDIDGIMTALNKKSEELGNEKITELFLWDENKEKFIWNDELLK